jgi:hypothetical protein
MTAQPDVPVVACALAGCERPAQPVSAARPGELYRHCSRDHADLDGQGRVAVATEAGEAELAEILDLPRPAPVDVEMADLGEAGDPVPDPPAVDEEPPVPEITCSYVPCALPPMAPGGRGWQKRYCSWAHVQAAQAAPAHDPPPAPAAEPVEAQDQDPAPVPAPEPLSAASEGAADPPSEAPEAAGRSFIDGVSVALEVAYALQRSATFRGLDDDTAKAIIREALS